MSIGAPKVPIGAPKVPVWAPKMSILTPKVSIWAPKVPAEAPVVVGRQLGVRRRVRRVGGVGARLGRRVGETVKLKI